MKESRVIHKHGAKHYVWLVALFIGIVVVLVGLATSGISAKAGDPTGGPGAANSQPDDITYPIQENFETGNIDAFYSAVPTCVPGGCGWRAVTTAEHTGTYAAYAPDVANVADQRMVTDSAISIPANATVATLSFWHSFDFEASGSNYYDGGVLEVSTDSGTNWSSNGVVFVSGGYNVVLHASSNPLAGRNAWGGSTGGAFLQVQTNLIGFAGHSILIRFREGTDASNGAGGWWVDDVLLTLSTPAPCMAGVWNLVSSYPTNIAFQASIALNGRLYMFGGVDNTGTKLSTAYRYDPGRDRWPLIAPLPAARYGAAATTDGTYIYILGGNDQGDNPQANLWRYDPVANMYDTLASYSYPTYLHAAVYLNGKIYRIAGSHNNTSTNSVEVYDVSGNTWSPTTNYPLSVQALNALAYAGYIITAGGDDNGVGLKNKTYRYNPADATWNDAAIPDLPTVRSGSVSGWLNGRWMIASGYTSSSPDTSVVVWDPGTNSWSSLPNTLQAFAFAGGGAVGQTFFMVGGQNNNSQRSAVVQRYTEVPCVPFTPTVGPSPTSCTLQYSDVPQGSTFYANIRCLACRGIVSGYPDGTFKPNNNVTRGQLSKIVSNAAGFSDTQSTQLFQDVPLGSTFFQFIGRLASRGFIGGYPCGGAGEPCGGGNLPYFRPNNNASRGQISKIVSNTAGFSDAQPNQLFQDVPLNSTFQVYIGRLASRGYMNGYPCGGAGEACIPPGNLPYFRPGNNATRGQTSKIVGNTFFPNCQTPSSAK